MKQEFDELKKLRFKQFIDGYNMINTKLKETYQVRNFINSLGFN